MAALPCRASGRLQLRTAYLPEKRVQVPERGKGGIQSTSMLTWEEVQSGIEETKVKPWIYLERLVVGNGRLWEEPLEPIPGDSCHWKIPTKYAPIYPHGEWSTARLPTTDHRDKINLCGPQPSTRGSCRATVPSFLDSSPFLTIVPWDNWSALVLATKAMLDPHRRDPLDLEGRCPHLTLCPWFPLGFPTHKQGVRGSPGAFGGAWG